MAKTKLSDEVILAFQSQPQDVFTKDEILHFFFAYQQSADETLHVSFENFIKELGSLGVMQKTKITQPNGKEINLYFKGRPSIYQVAVSLKPEAYISHQTAAFLHGLIDTPSSITYTTHEQAPKVRKEALLEQSAVDQAFSQEQNTSGATYRYLDYTILLLNGMFSGREGVYRGNGSHFQFPLTNIERTLIDVTVRPAYSGGATAILEMYKRGLKKKLAVDELVGILNTIPFLYPYHQAIGFYLERAGYKGSALKSLKKKGLHIDFYLDYNMEQTAYSSEWRIFYPAGMNDP